MRGAIVIFDDDDDDDDDDDARLNKDAWGSVRIARVSSSSVLFKWHNSYLVKRHNAKLQPKTAVVKPYFSQTVKCSNKSMIIHV